MGWSCVIRTPMDSKPFLGVVHLHALPSSAGQACDFGAVVEQAMQDARTLVEGGVDGVMVENFGDAPFHKGTREDPVPPDVPAGLAVVADRIRRECGVSVGINCLRNDGVAALGAAAVSGARWIRINVLTGSYVTDQGVIDGEAARVQAYKNQLGCDVEILADFMVKHASPLGSFDPVVGARDLAQRSGASALILTGDRTGSGVDLEFLNTIRMAVQGFPVWIGSGLSPESAQQLWPLCDGAIVGSSLQAGGMAGQPVELERVRAMRAALSA